MFLTETTKWFIAGVVAIVYTVVDYIREKKKKKTSIGK
ncbi:hypothetical protein ES703_123606 [subsurface metagenome]